MDKAILIRRDPLNVYHRFLRKERVGRQACHQVNHEADYRPVSRVFNLSHILEFIINCLNQRPFPQEDLVRDSHDLAFHVVLEFCNQLNTLHKELGEEVLTDIALVADQFAEDLLKEGLVPERFPVIDITWREHEVQQSSLLVANQMELEDIEAAHGALPTLGKPLEDFVKMDALVPTDTQGGTVHETDPSAASHAALLYEQDERNGHLPLQFYEAVIGNSLGKQVRHIYANFTQVEVFQTFISTQVEQYHNGDHLSIGQYAVTEVLPLRLVPFGSKSVNLDKSVVNMAEIINLTENFSSFVLGDRHSESVCIWFVVIPNLQKLSLFS